MVAVAAVVCVAVSLVVLSTTPAGVELADGRPAPAVPVGDLERAWLLPLEVDDQVDHLGGGLVVASTSDGDGSTNVAMLDPATGEDRLVDPNRGQRRGRRPR